MQNTIKTTQTQKKIIDSLVEIMKRKSFSSISIKEITEHSELSRKTFYSYYKKKDDVLYQYMTSIHLSYLTNFAINNDADLINMLNHYFQFWFKRRNFLEILLEQDLLYILNNSLDSLVYIASPLIKKEFLHLYSDLFLDYYNVYLSGAVTSVLKMWVKRGFEDSPEELSIILIDLIRNKIH